MVSAEFDAYSEDYDAALDRGISLSGEDKDYFASGRIRWLRRRLDELTLSPARILDFGCGVGSATQHFRASFPDAEIRGVDASARSIDVARRTHQDSRVRFELQSEVVADGAFDLVFCNGVFHHIKPAERPGCVDFIRRCLRPGGVFALWDNNPWNPGTHIVMARIPFDRDAVKLSAFGARRMLRRGGLEIVRTDHQFVVPAPLAWLRGLEPLLACAPLGAQFMVLARNPDAAAR
jgi:SAM-dependent methyltransferase